MTPDILNAVFECAGGAFVAASVVRLHRDKRVAGVSLYSVGFFALWGLWNLFYYPALEQWWSAVGAIGVAAMNLTWFGQIIYYRRKGVRYRVFYGPLS